jgi:hypothetical protein
MSNGLNNEVSNIKRDVRGETLMGGCLNSEVRKVERDVRGQCLVVSFFHLFSLCGLVPLIDLVSSIFVSSIFVSLYL